MTKFVTIETLITYVECSTSSGYSLNKAHANQNQMKKKTQLKYSKKNINLFIFDLKGKQNKINVLNEIKI